MVLFTVTSWSPPYFALVVCILTTTCLLHSTSVATSIAPGYHNHALALNQATSRIRAAYLASHLPVLHPFISCAVAELLARAGAAAAAAHAGSLGEEDPPTSQPDQIKAVLRDYQVWLDVNNIRWSV